MRPRIYTPRRQRLSNTSADAGGPNMKSCWSARQARWNRKCARHSRTVPRMHGEFLLSELARRGFTPSHGFPVDVVSFDHLSGYRRNDEKEKIAFGDYRGGASRTLDV